MKNKESELVTWIGSDEVNWVVFKYFGDGKQSFSGSKCLMATSAGQHSILYLQNIYLITEGHIIYLSIPVYF